MCVEVADAGEEDLAVDAECGADLDDLRDLLELRGEAVAGGEDGLERGDGLDGVGEGLGVGVGVGGDGVVGLHEGEAGAEAEEGLRGGLLRAALGGALGALAGAEVAGADGDGRAAGSVAEESVAGDGGDHGDGGVGVVGDVEGVGDAAGPAGLGGSALRGVLPLELLVGVGEEIGGAGLAGLVLACGWWAATRVPTLVTMAAALLLKSDWMSGRLGLRAKLGSGASWRSWFCGMASGPRMVE